MHKGTKASRHKGNQATEAQMHKARQPGKGFGTIPTFVGTTSEGEAV